MSDKYPSNTNPSNETDSYTIDAGRKYLVRQIVAYVSKGDRPSGAFVPSGRLFMVGMPDISNRRAVLREASFMLNALLDAGLLPESERAYERLEALRG